MKRSQSIKPLSCAMPVCCTLPSPASGEHLSSVCTSACLSRVYVQAHCPQQHPREPLLELAVGQPNPSGQHPTKTQSPISIHPASSLPFLLTHSSWDIHFHIIYFRRSFFQSPKDL